jgi:hypothetical protein
MAPASESGGKAFKAIHRPHLEAGISDVLAGKRAMRQSLFGSDNPTRRQRDALAPPSPPSSSLSPPSSSRCSATRPADNVNPQCDLLLVTQLDQRTS